MPTILLNNKFEVDFNFAFVGKKNLLNNANKIRVKEEKRNQNTFS